MADFGPLVKPRNLYIIGAQSTGKTTLVAALSRGFETAIICNEPSVPPPIIIHEIARSVLRRHSFTAADIRNSPHRALELQQLILDAQNEAEAAADGHWFVSDRSGIDTVVYAARYGVLGGVQQLMTSSAWSKVHQRLESSVIIVCEAGGPWLVDDGTRLMPQDQGEWLEFHHQFCRFLEAQELEYTVLPRTLVDLGARVDFVWKLWAARCSGL